MPLFLRFLAEDDGATAIEYALIAAMIAIIAIGGLTAFGSAVSDKFMFVATSVSSAGS